ncbi:MAG: efflux RND transporter periplasmic adaptor subunit [Desulfovibrionaceae bacterium]|nr:efflux RND transporter periplasmic adaptor subunit [Desulfovibrionaceae bacterium]
MEVQALKRKKKKGILWSTSILLILILCIGVGYVFYMRYRIHENVLEVLSTGVVDVGTVQGFFDATGVIKTEDKATVTVSSRVSGVVNKVFINTGDTVSKNQRLVSLDTKDIAITVQEAEATFAKANAELQRIKEIFPLQLEGAKRALALAQDAHTLAVAIKEKTVKDTKHLPAIEVDKLNHNILVAQNNIDSTQQQIDTLQKEYTIGLETAQASVQQAQAQVALVKNQASYYAVFSPMNATVSQIFVKEGEQIVASSPIATLIDTTKMQLWIYIDESDIGSVKKNSLVTYTVDALPDVVFKGAIAQIYPQPEIRDGVVYYKAIVPIPVKEAKRLYTDMTTQVDILSKEAKNVIRVPNKAIKWIDSERVVYVQDEEGFRKVVPTLGISGKEYTEVIDGLQDGDIVALDIRI